MVAPTLSIAALTEHLRQRIDPVFLPRPLMMVERLPRNATGKLPQQALQRSPLAPASDRRAVSTQALLHAYRGRPSRVRRAIFPDSPVLPGAVLLDEALQVIERAWRIDLRQWQIASAKFFGAVRPGDALSLEHHRPRAA